MLVDILPCLLHSQSLALRGYNLSDFVAANLEALSPIIINTNLKILKIYDSLYHALCSHSPFSVASMYIFPLKDNTARRKIHVSKLENEFSF